MKHALIIGISDSREQWFPPHVAQRIAAGRVFSGGKRHHEIMARWLPEGAVWIDITVPLADVFRRYEAHNEVVIFASGDPLFFGFANTVMRELPECRVEVIPSFNSLQMLAHRMCLPYHDMHVVSLTGRPWDKFDEALIRGEQLIGVLTDRKKTPQVILQRMADYGYTNYTATVGENLGNEESERVTQMKNEECRMKNEECRMKNEEWRRMENGEWRMENGGVMAEFSVPNCMILQQTRLRQHPLGIPEQEFELLNGRAKMITKMPIRLLSISMMDLQRRQSMWDVGFCTGSVSIEAKLQFPHLHITSFEIREEGRHLMEENSRRFGAPGIETVITDFMAEDISQYERPDAVFIGGHGGRLAEMVVKLKAVLKPGGCIVFNSVSEQSRQLFEDGVRAAGMTIVQTTRIVIDENNPILIMKAE